MNDAEQPHFPDPIEALIVVLSAFSLIILTGLIYNLIQSGGVEFEQTNNNMQIFFIFGGSLFLIVPLAYSRFRHYEIKYLFRFNTVSSRTMIQAALIGIAITFLTDEMDRIMNFFISMPDWLNEQLEPLKAGNTFELILIILGAVIVASVAEEGLFRGFLQHSLERNGDVTRAVLLSALIWTLIHMNLYWAIQLFLMGVVIGYMAWRTNSIIPAVIIHGVNNLLGVLFLNYDMDQYMGWYEWQGHVSPIVLIISAAILYFSLKNVKRIH